MELQCLCIGSHWRCRNRLNSHYDGGALDTYGLDVGYSITPDLNASVGYYYQQGDLDDADGSGVTGRLAYNISNGFTLGANLSYDEAFDTRFTADIKYRFGSNGYGAPSKKEPAVMPAIQALSATPDNRDVRVHDGCEINTAEEWVTLFLLLGTPLVRCF